MKTAQTRLALIILTCVLGTLIGTGCNTFRGIGRDVEHVGNHIERAAR